MAIIIGSDTNNYFLGQSTLQVTDGDTAYADDVNGLTQKTNTAFDLVEIDIDALKVGFGLSQEWASNDQGDKPVATGDDYSSKAYAIESKDWSNASDGTFSAGDTIHLADGTTESHPSSETSATYSEEQAVLADAARVSAEAAAAQAQGQNTISAGDDIVITQTGSSPSVDFEINNEFGVPTITQGDNIVVTRTGIGTPADPYDYEIDNEFGVPTITQGDNIVVTRTGTGTPIDPYDYEIDSSEKAYRKNDIINGAFDIWQRGDSQATVGYGSCDRYNLMFQSHSLSVAKQYCNSDVFSGTGSYNNLGVTSNPLYYCETEVIVTDSSDTTGYALQHQRVEDVTKWANKKVCITFWAKAATSGDQISLSGIQDFGTGGSSQVGAINPVKITLSNVFQKFVYYFDFPAINGKTIGAGSWQGIYFWFSAGSAYNTITSGLTLQSSVIHLTDITACPVEGEFSPLIRKNTLEEELNSCYRYYQKSDGKVYFTGNETTTGFYSNTLSFSKTMRTAPTINLSNTGYNSNSLTGGTITTPSPTKDGFRVVMLDGTGGTDGNSTGIYLEYTADAEL